MAVSRQLATVDIEERGPRARTRRLMLETATRLMQEGGTPSVTEVAEAAGVSRATAYRYFPSQAALVHAVVDEALGPILDWSSASNDAEARVADLFRLAMPRIAEFEATFKAALRLSLEQWAKRRAGTLGPEPQFTRGHRTAERRVRRTIDREARELGRGVRLDQCVDQMQRARGAEHRDGPVRRKGPRLHDHEPEVRIVVDVVMREEHATQVAHGEAGSIELAQHAVAILVEKLEAFPALGLIGEVVQIFFERELAVVIGVLLLEDRMPVARGGIVFAFRCGFALGGGTAFLCLSGFRRAITRGTRRQGLHPRQCFVSE